MSRLKRKGEKIYTLFYAKRSHRDLWEKIAEDYYSNSHQTCRIVDDLIKDYLPKYLKKVPKIGIILELGGGAGVLDKFKEINDSKIIILDISLNMLKKKNNSNKEIPRVQASADYLPFREEKFNAIISILGDSYIQPKHFKLLNNLLKDSGIFILVLPSKRWSLTLRSILGVDEQSTIFHGKSYEEIIVPSYLYSENELREVFRRNGFNNLNVRSYAIKDKGQGLSSHIIDPIQYLNVSSKDLPLLTFAIGFKKNFS